MATKILMPKLSDTMTEGVILKWRYKEGDKVKQGETLVEIESDKADMELEAYDSGILRKIIVPTRGKAPIGAAIGIIGDANDDIASLLTDAAPPKAAPSPAQVKPEPSTVAPAPPKTTTAPAPQPVTPGDGRVKASPLARRWATEKKIDLRTIPGSGPQGRIIKRDIESAVSGKVGMPAPTYAAIQPGTSQDVELSPIRKTIAKRMTESKQTAPHFYVTIEVDMEPAMAFREQLNNVFDSKISFTDILVKACANALMLHPQVNGSFLGNAMRQYGYAHIAVAVALDDGLVTPVLKNCEQKGIGRINQELRDLVERARNRKLKPEEYSGGTFTISNLGMFGVDEFVAIINPPEGAILAVGSIMEKPVVKDEKIIIGHTMRLTLSSDHRIIDGAAAARFLQDLRKLIENPASLVSIS
ncbi:MAG: pyruvate dehydrogenase complex dihydrolipoamide acetyltransferase [Bacteroidota bacterium]